MKLKMSLVFCIVLLLAACPVFAKTIYVDRGGYGAFTSIQAAYDDSNTRDGDIIVLASNQVFHENILLNTKRVTIRSENPPLSGGAVIESVEESENPIISITGNGQGENPAAGTVIENITLRYGSIYSAISINDPTKLRGIALYISTPSVSINNCIICENDFMAVSCMETTDVTFSGCRFNNNGNTSSIPVPGAMQLAGSDNITIVDCIFSQNNSGTGERGGGIYIVGSKNINISGCDFDLNNASKGAAVYCDIASETHFRDCAFTAGFATSHAGAVYSEPSIDIPDYLPPGYEFPPEIPDYMLRGGGIHADFQNCRFEYNGSFEGGAALYSVSSDLMFYNCTFIENGQGYATGTIRGGAVTTIKCTSQFVNCLFRDNCIVTSGTGYGGAIYNDATSGTIINCTFYENHSITDGSSGYGGAIYNTGGSCPVISNSIFRLNYSNGQIANHSPDDDKPQFYHNLIYSSGGSGENWMTALGIDKGGNIDAIPEFVSEDDLRLTAASPCIDAGRTEFVPRDIFDANNDGDTLEWLPIDLDGNNRFSNIPDVKDTAAKSYPGLIAVDMGAYECQGLSNIGGIPGDIDGSGKVDFADFTIFARHWLEE